MQFPQRFAWFQQALLSRWRDAIVLTILWFLGVCVALVFGVQPLWQANQQARLQQQKALHRYQSLQVLAAFLPSEATLLQHPLPSLTPTAKQPSVTLLLKKLQPSLHTVSGGCDNPHTTASFKWQECHWTCVGDAEATSLLMNELAEQPAWIMAQVRLKSFKNQWKLSVAGFALSATP